MADLGKTAAKAGERVQASPVYRGAVTGGLWAYGLVHFLLAWLTFQLIQTPGGARPTRRRWRHSPPCRWAGR